MRGRCFEVSGNRWRSREDLPGDLFFTAELLGMDGDRPMMENMGWSFVLEKNHYTGKQKILAKHASGFCASGALEAIKGSSPHVYLINLSNTRYGEKLNAEFVKIAKSEAMDLETLEPSILLEILSRIYLPVKKKIRKIVDIENYINRKAA